MRRLSAVLSFLLCLGFLPFYLPSFSASADWSNSYPVELTSAQTLALYGQSINALYYNGSSTSTVTFTYWKSSRTLVSQCENAFAASPFLTGYSTQNLFGLDLPSFSAAIRSENRTDLSGWFTGSNEFQKTDFLPYECLIYKAQFDPLPVNERDFDFQIHIDFPVNMAGVERIRSFYGVSVGSVASLSTTASTTGSTPTASNFGMSLRLYADSDNINPIYTTAQLVNKNYNARYSFTVHPVTFAFNSTYDNLTPDSESINAALYPAPIFGLNAVDTSGITNSYTLDSISWNIRAAQGVVVKSDDSYSSGDFQYDPIAVYLLVMCPVFWGDVTPPEPPVTIPNYDSQLDNIQTGIGQINENLDSVNNRLDTIIDQLDDIYQKMCEDAGADLVPPDQIGLDATAKQRVLTGLSSLDSQLDSVQPSDVPQNAMQGIGSFWSRIKAVLPSGLMSVYMLCLVGGIVSWIIYGKRGG